MTSGTTHRPFVAPTRIFAGPAIVSLLLIAMAGCADSTGLAEEEQESPQDRLLLVRGSGAECTGSSCDRDIYSVNLDGSDLENLTESPAQYRDLRLSPDGETLVFVSDRSGCPNVWTMKVDGTELLQLTGHEADSRCNQDPRWSPDGEWIAFFSSDDPDLGWEVHVIRPDGSDRANITNHAANDLVQAFTADGRLVILSDRDTGVMRYHVMDRDGTGIERLFPDAEGDPNWILPYWSADGTLAVYGQDDAGASELYVAASGEPVDVVSIAAGSPVRPVGSFWSNPWSPDGTRLALEREDESGSVDVWILDADGSGLTNVTNSPDSDWFNGWSPDGSRILFTSGRDGNREIYRANLDGTGVTNLTEDPADDVLAVWVPADS